MRVGNVWSIAVISAISACLLACAPNGEIKAGGAIPVQENGNEGSGGGSGYAADFTNIGYRAVKVIDSVPGFPATSAAFNATVMSTRVEFVDHTLLDPNGFEVDALNFPQRKLIKVNIKRWDGLFSYPVEKYQLVVHEYLGIMQIDDSEYRQTYKILDGGIRFWGIRCSYELGILDWYMVDTAAGDTKVEARFGTDQGVFGNVVIGVSGTGVILSWADVDGMETAYFSDFDRVNTPGAFKEDYFLQVGFDGTTHVPLFENKGTMNCAVQKMEPGKN